MRVKGAMGYMTCDHCPGAFDVVISKKENGDPVVMWLCATCARIKDTENEVFGDQVKVMEYAEAKVHMLKQQKALWKLWDE